MKRNKSNSLMHKIIFGNTKTRQVSGASIKIVSNKELSEAIYSKIDSSDQFTVKSKDGKVYRVRHLVPSK